MAKIRRSTTRSETSLLSITQLENALHQLNAAIHKKPSPKRLFSKFKTAKLDEYRRSIIERALQDQSQVNNSSNNNNNNKTSKLIPTSTPMTKSLNYKKNHTADADRNNSLLLISPIAKTSSTSSPDKSKSPNDLEKSLQNLSKSKQNSKNSIINEILPAQLHNEWSINKNKSTTKRNKSIQNAEEQTNVREISAITEKQHEIEILPTVELHNVQQLNKSTNTSKLNNNVQQLNKSTNISKLSNNVRLNKSTNTSKLNNNVQLNKSTNTSKLNNIVQQLNKSKNSSKLNNTETCNNDELSSARAEVEKFFEDLNNHVLGINNDSMMNETSSIVLTKPWRVSKSFALPSKSLNSLGRNSSLVKHLNEKLPPTKSRTNKKSFANKKSIAAVENNQESEDCNEQNNRQVAIFESFMDKPDDNNDLDGSDSDLSDGDLESVMSFLNSVIKPNTAISVSFCDDDDDDDGDGHGQNVNNRKSTKKIASFGKNKNQIQPSTSKASTSKQVFNEPQIRTVLENINDTRKKIQLVNHNGTKRSKTTKQSLEKAKKTGLENIGDNQDEICLIDRNNPKRSTTKQLSKKAKKTNRKNNNNNVNKRSCPTIPESSFSNDEPTKDTQEGLRRTSRVRKPVQFKEMGRIHGAKRVFAFFILTALLPATLIIIPLYLRHSLFADIQYPVAESDIIAIVDGTSSIFCESHTLKMNTTFNAFQLIGKPQMSTKRRHIRLKKSMSLPDDTLEYWGFFLLKGAIVKLKVCSRYPGSRILVVRGEKNLKTCGLLQHNLKYNAKMDQEHHRVKVTFENAAEVLGVYDDNILDKNRAVEEQTIGENVDDFVKTRLFKNKRNNTENYHNTTRRHANKRKLHHKQLHKLQELLQPEEDVKLKITQPKKRDIAALDAPIAHGGNALNFTDSDSNSVSSFETDLLTCYAGQILLTQGFAPSHSCNNIQYLEKSNHMTTLHEVARDGYYYYIFYSDNDYVRNDIHAIFDIYKPTYRFANVTKGNDCINQTECNFPISFLSDETVIVEVPTKDGIEHNDSDVALLTSTCHPRMTIYMIFPLSAIFLILGCAFL